MAEIIFPDPTLTNPWQDPVSLQWWEHDGDGWLRFNPNASTGIITGYKNALINSRLGPFIDGQVPSWTINQRNFDGNWSNIPADKYGYDHWRTHLFSGARMKQSVETADVVIGATYTYSWDGGGNGEVRTGLDNAIISGVSPLTFVMPDAPSAKGAAIEVNVDVGAFNIQLEQGAAATEFEIRPVGLELALCQRYYWPIPQYQGAIISANSDFRIVQIQFPVEMRVIPIIIDSWTSGTTGQVFPTVQGFTARTDVGNSTNQPNYNGG